ncbi:MAG: hypothetical protein EOL86_03250 [Deltaproteobacteria bacterium]|nr:hypothetical protein [Deltaproteobacteria bacterium]
MTTIMPTDKNLRNAIAWIEDHVPNRENLTRLMDEAGRRFNLTPLEEEALARFYRDRKEDGCR